MIEIKFTAETPQSLFASIAAFAAGKPAEKPKTKTELAAEAKAAEVAAAEAKAAEAVSSPAAALVQLTQPVIPQQQPVQQSPFPQQQQQPLPQMFAQQPQVQPQVFAQQPQMFAQPQQQFQAAAPTYTVDDITRAIGPLIATRQPELMALLAQFGVQELSAIPQQSLGMFVQMIRQMGAQI